MESSDDKAARGLKQARARGIREFASERYDIGEIHFDFFFHNEIVPNTGIF